MKNRLRNNYSYKRRKSLREDTTTTKNYFLEDRLKLPSNNTEKKQSKACRIYICCKKHFPDKGLAT